MKRFAYFLLIAFSALSGGLDGAQAQSLQSERLRWEQLPDLPLAEGVAGAFAGTHGNALIVAGGANFPDGLPWVQNSSGDFPIKHYHDRIFVLRQANSSDPAEGASAAPRFQWSEATTRLPEPLAYGVSVSTSKGVLCAGGEGYASLDGKNTTEVRRSRSVFLLRWDKKNQTIEVRDTWQFAGRQLPLPPLPVALSSACGAVVGKYFYIASGDSGEGGSRHFWRLDLEPSAEAISGTSGWQWEELPSWNGPPRSHAIAVSQSGHFLLISGRAKQSDGPLQIHTDAHRFDPAEYKRALEQAVRMGATPKDLPIYANGWTRLADVGVRMGEPRSVMAGTAVAAGYDHILVFGGASGEIMRMHDEILPQRIAGAEAAGNEELAAQLRAERDALYNDHPGFSSDVLSYCLTTDRWSQFANMPTTGPVTTTAVRMGDRILFPSGESRPGVRTPAVWSAQFHRRDKAFGVANWAVLGGYLLMMVGIGYIFSRSDATTNDYFVAGNRIPWWAAGLSIFATMLSAITYLGIPARSYATNWSWSLLNFGIPVVALVVITFYLPRLLQIRGASIYEFLESRFDLSLRLLGNLSYMLFQLGRTGIVILLPSLALSAVTGLDVMLCIVIMGVLSTLYTVMGGIEAVIWTDVVQVIVLLGGAIAVLVCVSLSVDGGIVGVLQTAASHGKFDFVNSPRNHDLSWTNDGILVVLIAALFVNLIPYCSDQAVAQRYLTVKDERQATKAIWANAIMSIPATLLFFLLGTVLWVFYTSHPAQLEPLAKGDQILPWFIAQEMPAGLAGLIIAGVFAAAMSSLDSSIHSVSTVLTVDYYDRFWNDGDSVKSLRFARVSTVLLGALSTLSALVLANMETGLLWDLFQSILGLFLGTVGGLFTLAVFTRRVGTLHAWIGAIVSIAVLAYVQSATSINGLLYGAISLATCVVVALAASCIVPTGGGTKSELYERNPA